MKVDPVTMVCAPHGIGGCEPCMVDDFHAWLDAKAAKRAQLKLERAAMTIEERFDLGGEA